MSRHCQGMGVEGASLAQLAQLAPSLESGTERGMPRALSFCCGQMLRGNGKTKRTRRHVGDYSGEPGRFTSATAERLVRA